MQAHREDARGKREWEHQVLEPLPGSHEIFAGEAEVATEPP